MNISPLKTSPTNTSFWQNKVRALLPIAIATTISASVSIGFSDYSFAGETQSADNAPRFTVEESSKRIVNKGVTAYMKGDYSKAAAFNRNALHQGLKISHKTVVYSNQCATLGAQGRFDDALDACDKALKLSPSNWQAYSNRAAVNWLSGDKSQARQDIEAAKREGGETSNIIHNIGVFG